MPSLSNVANVIFTKFFVHYILGANAFMALLTTSFDHHCDVVRPPYSRQSHMLVDRGRGLPEANTNHLVALFARVLY